MRPPPHEHGLSAPSWRRGWTGRNVPGACDSLAGICRRRHQPGSSSPHVNAKSTWNVSDALQVNFNAEYTETDDEHHTSLFQPDLACYTPGGTPCEITAPGAKPAVTSQKVSVRSTTGKYQRESPDFCNRVEYGLPEIDGHRSWTLKAATRQGLTRPVRCKRRLRIDQLLQLPHRGQRSPGSPPGISTSMGWSPRATSPAAISMATSMRR